MAMHPGQLDVDVLVARRLVAEQFPGWSERPVRAVASSGTVNTVFRLGDDLALRFPLAGVDVEESRRSWEAEHDAAREARGAVGCPTPEPVAIGEPGAGYPLCWSVQTWLPGRVAEPTDGTDHLADDVADLVTAFGRLDVRGRRFARTGRGGHLPDHDDWMETCFAASGLLLDVPALRRLWVAWRTLPRTTPDAITHGDLIPANLLLSPSGRLTGVIDLGSLGPADPALDLVVAWHLFDTGPRTRFRARLGCDDLTWFRGQAWAFQQAMGLVWYYVESHPAMSALGRRTLDRLLADGAQP